MDISLYNDSYETIYSNFTDSNVGAKRGRGVRDNIYVINVITNSVINGNSRPIQIQVMGVINFFDKLWLEACMNSFYDAGIKDDRLNLLYIENQHAQIAIKVNNMV